MGILFISVAFLARYLPDVVREVGEDNFGDPAAFGEIHNSLKSLPLRVLYKRRANRLGRRRAADALDTDVDERFSHLKKLRRREQLDTLRAIIADADDLHKAHGERMEAWLSGDDEAFVSAEECCEGGDDQVSNDSMKSEDGAQAAHPWRALFATAVMVALPLIVNTAYATGEGGVSV